MAEFGSVEHVKSLSRRKLENLFRYVFESRNGLETIIKQQDKEITELRRRVANQSRQLKEVQTALERRNSELKPRWQRKVKGLEMERDKYRVLIYDLRAHDGWPDDDKLSDYGIDPSEVS